MLKSACSYIRSKRPINGLIIEGQSIYFLSKWTLRATALTWITTLGSGLQVLDFEVCSPEPQALYPKSKS